MTSARAILEGASSILLVDWPSKEVPDTLARAGYTVFAKGGPERDYYTAFELRDDEIAQSTTDRVPQHLDVVYVHRPIDELPAIVALAEAHGATSLWYQSGRASTGRPDPTACWLPSEAVDELHRIADAAGLQCISDAYIVDVARQLDRSR